MIDGKLTAEDEAALAEAKFLPAGSNENSTVQERVSASEEGTRAGAEMNSGGQGPVAAVGIFKVFLERRGGAAWSRAPITSGQRCKIRCSIFSCETVVRRAKPPTVCIKPRLSDVFQRKTRPEGWSGRVI